MSKQPKIENVDVIYVGSVGEREVGIPSAEFTIEGGLIFQPGMYGDEEEAREELEKFREALKDAFELVLDPVSYVEFDFERKARIQEEELTFDLPE